MNAWGQGVRRLSPSLPELTVTHSAHGKVDREISHVDTGKCRGGPFRQLDRLGQDARVTGLLQLAQDDELVRRHILKRLELQRDCVPYAMRGVSAAAMPACGDAASR